MKHPRRSLVSAFFVFSLVACALFGRAVQAAPLPNGSLGKLAAPKLGIYKSPLGYEVSAAGSGWLPSDPPEGHRYIQTVYRAPSSGDASSAPPTLTVRADRLERPTSLERYVQRWQKEYPKYGFDVIGAKAFSQNKTQGYVLDLLNRTGQKQLRQTIFLKGRTAVIMTCRDQAATFKDSLRSCNQIIKSFRWAE